MKGELKLNSTHIRQYFNGSSTEKSNKIALFDISL